MLELTGCCVGGIEAIEFMEMLADVIPEECKTEIFCEEYEAVLNRFRYEVAKGIGTKKKITKAMKRSYKDLLNCGKCGFCANEPSWKYCPNCGTRYLNPANVTCEEDEKNAHQLTGQMSIADIPGVMP